MIQVDDKLYGLLARLTAAIEEIAVKPPTIITVPRPQPSERDVRDEPRTADGVRYRHRLKSGGYLIEVVTEDGGVAFVHEDDQQNRRQLVFSS